MSSTGMDLTVDGFNKVKELDTNGDGKIEEGEVKGYDFNANATNCISCIIWNCLTTFSCVHGTSTIINNSSITSQGLTKLTSGACSHDKPDKSINSNYDF